MNFLQQLLSEEKHTLKQAEITAMPVHKHWPEFAISNVWPQVSHHERLRKYMPTDEMDQQRWPDREFFWNVLFTILPEWAEAYVTAVNHQRNQTTVKSPAKEVRTIRVTDQWE